MNITVDKIKSNYNLIDIRPNNQYNLGHILNAKNIPYSNLIMNYKIYLDKNKTYYIYCNYGQTSKGVCNYLQKQGYKVYNIIGGYKAWNKYNEL